MEEFKLKKIKLTNAEEIIIFILLILIGFIVLAYPINTKDTLVNNKPKTIDEELKDQNINDVIYKSLMDNKYLLVSYNENNKIVSKVIDYKTEKIIPIESILNKNKINEYNQKIKELLLLKYPSKICDILINKGSKEYIFYDNYIQINYILSKDDLDTNRTFDLKVYYNEIKDYLNFHINSDINYENENGFNYDPNKITIVFSFDDGPNGNRTFKIVDLLEDYKMSATFFVLGNKLINGQDAVSKVYNSHSELGYHSFAHIQMTKQNAKTLQNDLIKSNEYLKQITGSTFKYVRPPYGSYNKSTLAALDLPVLRWNLDTNDWQYKDSEYIKKYVLDNYSSGSIILFHDSYDTTVEAIEKLLPVLYNLDVQVVSVSEYSKLYNILLNNHEVYYDFK